MPLSLARRAISYARRACSEYEPIHLHQRRHSVKRAVHNAKRRAIRIEAIQYLAQFLRLLALQATTCRPFSRGRSVYGPCRSVCRILQHFDNRFACPEAALRNGGDIAFVDHNTGFGKTCHISMVLAVVADTRQRQSYAALLEQIHNGGKRGGFSGVFRVPAIPMLFIQASFSLENMLRLSESSYFNIF